MAQTIYITVVPSLGELHVYEVCKRKPWTLVHGCQLHVETEFFNFGNRISAERASQEEQNGAKFSFVAPSIEELLVHKDI